MNHRLPDMESFIESTRDVVSVREVDGLLIIRPNRIQHLNATACALLLAAYSGTGDITSCMKPVSLRYGVPMDKILADLNELLASISAIMRDDYGSASRAMFIPYDYRSIAYPVLSEIALTYRCQNCCDFCYASSPLRGGEMHEMTTDEVKIIIGRIFNEAHVPTISFTGGEPTLRKDLPELVACASQTGLRTNLITNGIRCADISFVNELAAAGLKSAQVSLESHDAAMHDSITGNIGAFKKTVQGIANLASAGIHTHTNTTVCQKNHRHLKEVAGFVKSEFGFPYLSMNMIIATGTARDNDNTELGYSVIGEIISPVIEHCKKIGITFIWYSPTPYCIFNPLEHNLGSKSCACVSGLLSVNPAGQIIPCSSYDRGIGNFLKRSFDHIWNSDAALYYRERRYVPPVCKKCDTSDICAGACPLYWENAGGFNEIEKVRNEKPLLRNIAWKAEKKLRLRTGGVAGKFSEER